MKVLKEVIATYIEEEGKITIKETPLIRCKECKWLYKEQGIPWCSIWANATSDVNFCNYGERRTDE